jgi:hypothetical protein
VGHLAGVDGDAAVEMAPLSGAPDRWQEGVPFRPPGRP